jgi:hypothetical protein
MELFRRFITPKISSFFCCQPRILKMVSIRRLSMMLSSHSKLALMSMLAKSFIDTLVPAIKVAKPWLYIVYVSHACRAKKERRLRQITLPVNLLRLALVDLFWIMSVLYPCSYYLSVFLGDSASYFRSQFK